MKLKEAILKAIESKNPKLKHLSSGDIFELILQLYNIDGRYTLHLDVAKLDRYEDKWEIAEQPRDFMTAFKAFKNGKTIKWVGYEGNLSEIIRVYNPSENLDVPIMLYQIERGKWYIED